MNTLESRRATSTANLDAHRRTDANRAKTAQRWSINAGFSQQPKFPRPVNLDFCSATTGEPKTPKLLYGATYVTTICIGEECMTTGGGFHRYSTDKKWLVPHFEKMLYDNAQLASIHKRSKPLESLGMLLSRKIS